MNIPDALFQTVGDPITMGIFIFLVSVADDEGGIYMSYADIGESLGYTKNRVYKRIKKLLALGVINTPEKHPGNGEETTKKRSRNENCLATVCNIHSYRTEETTKKRSGNGRETITNRKQIPLETRKNEFGQKLVAHVEKYGSALIREFFDYWTETKENGQKMRFEKEPTFEIGKRLARWYNNNKKDKYVSSAEQRMHIDGTILHSGQMDVTKGGW